MRRIMLILVLLVQATSAAAGAWPREDGAAFVSLSFGEDRAAAYAEYGLGAKWTLGLDAGRSSYGTTDVMVFLQHPVRDQFLGGVLSAGLAVGQSDGEAAVRPGLFWGRGLTWPVSGWMSVDVQGDWVRGGDPAIKMDTTIGFKPTETVMVLLQSQSRYDISIDPVLQIEPTTRIEASVGFDIGDGRRIVLGRSFGLTEGTESATRVSVWLDF